MSILEQTAQDNLEISEELIRRFDSLGPRYTSYSTADRFYTGFTESFHIQYLKQRNDKVNKPLCLYIFIFHFALRFVEYFADELVRVQDNADDGLMKIGESTVSVTAKGRMFVRAFSMVFDQYPSRQSSVKYSRLI